MQNSIQNFRENVSAEENQRQDKQNRQKKLILLKETLNFIKDDDQLSLTWPKVTLEDENLLSALLYMAKPIESYNSHENSTFCIAIYEVVKKKCKNFVFNVHIEVSDSIYRMLSIKKTPKETDEDCLCDDTEQVAPNNWQTLKKSKDPLSQKKMSDSDKTTDVRMNRGLDKRNKDLTKAYQVPVNATKATRMMRLMGWEGGALGKTGDGITEPLMPYLSSVPGSGLGCIPKDQIEGKDLLKSHINVLGKKKAAHLSLIRQQFLSRINDLFQRNLQMVEIKLDRKLSKHELLSLKEICDVFNTQKGFQMFAESELPMVLAIQNSKSNWHINSTYSTGKRNILYIHRDIPRNINTAPVNLNIPSRVAAPLTAPIRTKKIQRNEIERMVTGSILRMFRNQTLCQTFVSFPTTVAKGIASASYKVVNKCNARRSQKNDKPEMNQVIHKMKSCSNLYLTMNFDEEQMCVTINKIEAKQPPSDLIILENISRESDEKLRTEINDVILSVLKGKTPQLYVNLYMPLSYSEKKILEDTINSFNNRETPMCYQSNFNLFVANEISQILKENLCVSLVLDFSTNEKYLRITKQFKLQTEKPLPEIEILTKPLFKYEILKFFINFYQMNEKTVILKLNFVLEMASSEASFYRYLKLFLNNRKDIAGLRNDIEALNLYNELYGVVMGGMDYGIIDKFSMDYTSITITKEPRFMTEIPFLSQLFNSNPVEVSDESDEEVSIVSDPSTEASAKTSNLNQYTVNTSNKKNDDITKLIEVKLYDLKDKRVVDIMSLLRDYKVNVPYKSLEKLACECKFLVNLEGFLREPLKIKVNIEGFPMKYEFVNSVVRDYNTRNQSLQCKFFPLSNLFKRLLQLDYCTLTVEFKEKQIIVINKIFNNKNIIVRNIDDDVAIIEEKIDVVDLTEEINENSQKNNVTPIDELFTAIEEIENEYEEITKINRNEENSKANTITDTQFSNSKILGSDTQNNDIVIINNDDDNNTQVVNLTKTVKNIEACGLNSAEKIDLTEEDNDVIYLPIVNSYENKNGFDFLKALTKRDYSLSYIPYGQMFNGTYINTHKESAAKRKCNRNWYPKQDQSMVISLTETNEESITTPKNDENLENDKEIPENSVIAIYEIIVDTYERVCKESIQQDQNKISVGEIDEMNTEDQSNNISVDNNNKDILSNEFIDDKTTNKDESLSDSGCMSSNQNTTVEFVDKYKDEYRNITTDNTLSNIEYNKDNPLRKIDTESIAISSNSLANDSATSIDLSIDVDEYDKDVVFVDTTVTDILFKDSALIPIETINLDEIVDTDPVIFLGNTMANKGSINTKRLPSNDKVIVDNDKQVIKESLSMDDGSFKECIAEDDSLNNDTFIDNDETASVFNESLNNSKLFNNTELLCDQSIMDESLNKDEIFTKDESTPNKDFIANDNEIVNESIEKSCQNVIIDESVTNNETLDSLHKENSKANEQTIINDNIIINREVLPQNDEFEATNTTSCTTKRFRCDSLKTDLNITKKLKLINFDTIKLEISFIDTEIKIDNLIASKIQTEILEEIKKTNFIPILKCLYLDKGKLFYKVTNEKSYDWLKKFINKLKINDDNLKLITNDIEESKLNIVMHFNSFIEETNTAILDKITEFNENIKTDNWKILNKTSFDFTKYFYIEIDLESLKAIEKSNFCLNLGVDTAYIHAPSRLYPY